MSDSADDSEDTNSDYISFVDSDSSDEEEDDIPVVQPLQPLEPCWSSVLESSETPPFLCEVGPSHSLGPADNEKQFFELIFDEKCVNTLTDGTNKYARETQERKGHDPVWYDCTTEEMRAYLGLLIIMGINKLPDYKLHWSKNKFLANSGFIEVMPVRRYEKLTQYLHCDSEDTDDPLCKVRPIMNLVSENILKSYKPRQHQTIDEGMIAYKGRHKAKQYIPSKPTRWGLKVWLRCDSISGFCHQLDIYLGRDQYSRGISVGQEVVLKLTESLEGKNFHVFYDSFFTSIALARSLLEKRIFSCGTIMRNRKGFPSDLKNLPRMNQGEYVTRQDGKLSATVWMDSRPVAILSTTASTVEMSANACRRLKDGTEISVPRPQSVGHYQAFFRGVDIFDQLRSKYSVGRPSKKWWKYVLHFLINTAIINTFLIMKESVNLPKKKYRQLDYRLALAKLLIGTFRTPPKTAARRQLSENSTTHKLIRLSCKRSYCKNCAKAVPKKRKDTSFGCGLCEVHLCGKQCFALFHNIEE
ncbi:piggyBac transposable element-derived protein 4-like [Saccostrea cucullata]|uniref:piggyBac transposable element-derived protein 4-like n=1 Tax=Saccostrea cuccullata TaxID=36930 RepID=UPI002ED14257